MFNEITAAAQARERIARFHREAEVRRFSPSPRRSFARFVRSAAAVKPDSAQGGRYVRT